MCNDHPLLLMALGFVPQTPLIDPEVMRRTLENVKADLEWPSTWGWDYLLLVMCVARLGDRAAAVDGLLAAVALIVASWDGGSEGSMPGFP
jgi:hypothetical protein